MTENQVEVSHVDLVANEDEPVNPKMTLHCVCLLQSASHRTSAPPNLKKPLSREMTKSQRGFSNVLSP